MKSKLTVYEITFCGLFTALIAIGAFIQIPVPGFDYFTLQFLFVLMSGMILGSKLGKISVLVYVLLGLVGLPIFAAGGGITYVLRPSFGYLVGFIVSAYATGKVVENMHACKFWHYLLAAFAGLIVTYSIGLVYKYMMLNLYIGEKTAFTLVILDCFPLDLPGDILLSCFSSVLAVRLSPISKRMIKGREHGYV